MGQATGQTFTNAGETGGFGATGMTEVRFIPSSMPAESADISADHSVQQSLNSFVDDGSKRAKTIRYAIENGVLLEGAEKKTAAMHMVGYESINDRNFTPDSTIAYRNLVINTIGQKGSRVVAGHLISGTANTRGLSLDQAILNGYEVAGNNGAMEHVNGWISDKSKIELYKSMMTSEQLDTLSGKESAGLSEQELLKFIEGNATSGAGLGLKLGVGYNNKTGISFNVNGNTVRGKGRQDDAVNFAITQMLRDNSEFADSAVESSLNATGYKKNARKALAGNYALGVDYQNETSGATLGGKHQQVFDTALKNDQIVAEAILAYLKKNPTLFEQFKTDYHINDDTQQDQILESIVASKKNKETIVGKLSVDDYKQELSEVTARHVADGSFGVEAYDLLSKTEQDKYADQMAANFAVASAGARFGFTQEQQQVVSGLSVEMMNNNPTYFVRSALNSNIENKDEIVNSLVGMHFGFAGSDGNINMDSEEAKKLLAEIEANKELSKVKVELTNQNYSEQDILLGYAKAKLTGSVTAETIKSATGNNALDIQAVESMLSGNAKTASVAEQAIESLDSKAVVERAISSGESKESVASQLALNALGIEHQNGAITVGSNSYTTMISEIIDRSGNNPDDLWYKKLESFGDMEGKDAQELVTMYSKAKLLGKEDSAEEFIGAKANVSKINDSVIDRVSNFDSSEAQKKKQVDEILENLEKYNTSLGTLEDSEIEEINEAHNKYTTLFNDVKSAFGYVEGGDAKVNSVAEDVASKYISSNGQNKDLVNSKGVKVNTDKLNEINANYFTYSNETGRTQAQDIIAGDIYQSITDEERSQLRAINNLRQEGNTKESLEKQLASLGYNLDTKEFDKTQEIGEVSIDRALQSMKVNYITADTKSASEAQVSENLKKLLTPEQIKSITREGSTNGFVALSQAGQNAVLVRMAGSDSGAKAVLANNNVSLNSPMEISQFLNSSLGLALKERLISELSVSLFELMAQRFGLSGKAVYDVVSTKADKAYEASLFEKTQGNLISNERVKQQLSENAESDNARNIVNFAAGKMSLLTKEEYGEISTKGAYEYLQTNYSKEVHDAETEISKKFDLKTLTESERREKVVKYISSVNPDAYRNALYIGGLDAVNNAKVNALSNGGLERQRAIAEVIYNNNDLKTRAESFYRTEHNGADLNLVSEVDRNNYLFDNYSKLVSSDSEAGKKIAEILSKSKVGFESGNNQTAINNLSQTEFNNIIRDMSSDGESIVSQSKQAIFTKANEGGKLTEIPDESKMTREERADYESLKSMLHQHYRKDENSEYIANLYRNTTLVNEEESLKAILSNGNSNATKEEIDKSKLTALENNKEFYGNTVLTVMKKTENAETLTKIIEKLKSQGVDFKSLSVAEKGQAITTLLKDDEFTKANKINAKKINTDINSEFTQRGASATNEEIKFGLTKEQINEYLRHNEGIRDNLISIGAHKPHKMFKKEHVMPARREYVFNNPVMRRMFVYAILHEMYTDKQLKSVIRKEILRPESSMFDSKFKNMTNAQIASYINSHLEELKYKLGLDKLFNKTKDGRFIPNNSMSIPQQDKTINNLEFSDKTFAGRMFDAFSSIARRATNNSSQSDKDNASKEEKEAVDELFDKVMEKVEKSSRLKTSVDKIVKTSVSDQINRFFEGEDVKVLVQSEVERVVNDPAIQERVYAKYNKELAKQKASLNSSLAAARKKLKG